MRVKDLMAVDVLAVEETMPLGQLLDQLTAAHVHAAPVIDADGQLVGMVTQEDILLGGLGFAAGSGAEVDTTVRDVMTSPAVSVGEEVHVTDVARMMWRMRIHHIPVVKSGSVVGIVSALDFCKLASDLAEAVAIADSDEGGESVADSAEGKTAPASDDA